MRKPLTPRQRLKTVLAHKIPDRVPMLDTTFWPGTIERWRKEGLPDGVGPAEYFGYDRIELFSYDGSLQLPGEIVEEGDRWRIRRDANGLLIKEMRDWRISDSPPVRLDCLVKSWDQWRKVKDRLAVDPGRVSEAMRNAYARWREQDRFVVIRPVEPMWFFVEQLTGFQTGLPLLVEQPDLAADILITYTDFILGMWQMFIDDGMEFDGVWFFSDLCYRNGMLFSPAVFRELLMPCLVRVREWCDRYGLALILHCDGDCSELIPLILEIGFDALQPLEARCGNDVRVYKREYGTRIAFFGNISSDVMASGTDEEVEHEVVSKVLAAKEGGGYIYHSDHSIPHTIGFERYARVMELVREHGRYD